MYVGKQFNEGLKQIGFILIILFLFVLIVSELKYFVSAVLGSFTLFLLLRKPHKKLKNKGFSTTLSTIILLLGTLIVLGLLGWWFVNIILNKLTNFQPSIVWDALKHIQDVVLTKTSYNIFSDEMLQRLINTFSNILPSLLSVTGNVLANLFMMFFILFFMLQQSNFLQRTVERLLPISRDSIDSLKHETDNMVVSNAVVIPLIMIAQGMLAGLAYWFLNAGDPVVFGLVTAFFGLVPVIGTAGVWLPLAINLFIGGNIWQAIVLVIWGALIVSYVDNIIRMVLLKKTADVHPLITIFGVILGLNLFGFWGIIFGPLVLSSFILLVKIYRREFLTD